MCIPPVPDQDLHVTLSEARIREDGHQARIVRSQQLTNQTVNIPQHKELGQILLGGLRLKVYPHQTNLKILQAIQPPRRHLAPSPPRMRRRQLRANLRYRTTLSRLQLSNASLAQPRRNACVPHSEALFKSQMHCRCLQVRKAFRVRHMRKQANVSHSSLENAGAA